MRDLIAKLVLLGDSSKMNAILKSSEGRFKAFGGAARREFESIKNAARSVEGKLGALGVSFGAVLLMKQSAELDRNLTRIGQTAGEGGIKVLGLRKELFRMAQETGQGVENLKQGFDNAVQAGLSFKEALPVTDAVNKAMAVTGASADQLTSGLTVAANAFQFDLAKPGMALNMLDRMTVAGRQGNAELESLSGIVSRVGGNATRSGMGFNEMLSFVEGLSQVEKLPERLATLADSTMRLFTNFQYLSRAQQATGVKFFDEKGARRGPFAVFQDIKKKYDLLKTDLQRTTFLNTALQGAYLDTIKGVGELLKGKNIEKMVGFNEKIANASGTIKKDLPAAINNAVDQTGRLKAKLREAADDFIQPFNQGIAKGIKKLIDPKKEGGYELSSKQIAAGGATALLSGYIAYRFGGKAAKAILGKLGGTAAGIAEGKMVEATTGVTPVFVTNWPGTSLLPGSNNDALKTAKDLVTGAALTRSGAILKTLKTYGSKALKLAPLAWNFMPPQVRLAGIAAGVLTYGGGMVADRLSGGEIKGPGWMGDALYDFLHKAENPKIELNVYTDRDGRVTVDANNTNTKINVPRGKF